MSTEDTLDPPPAPAAQPATGTGHGRVRWRRFAAMMIASAGAAATLVVLTAQGALAVSFSISGMPFVVTSSHVAGAGFEQFATLDQKTHKNPIDPDGQAVLIVSAIGDAQLTDLCQSIDLGGTYIKLTAGGKGTQVHAEAMVLDSTELSGNASFTNISIGQDAATLDAIKNQTKGKYNITGPDGVLGQQADSVVLDNLRQTNYATTAAVFSLPNLHMSFSDTPC